MGAAGEHLAASFFLAEGSPVYWPVAQSGWVDLVVQTQYGFKRVQVKTSATEGASVRVRSLGCSNGLNPADRYDLLAVVNGQRLWVIPAARLDGRDTITLRPRDPACTYQQNRRR